MQPRSRSRSASGKSGAAAYPSPTSTHDTGSLGWANGRPNGPVSSTLAPWLRSASQREPGPTGEYRVEVHLLKPVALVIDRAARDNFERCGQRLGLGAAMRLDNRQHDVDARALPLGALT